MRNVCVDCGRTFEPFMVRGRPSARCRVHAFQRVRDLDTQHNARNRATGRTTSHWQRIRAQVLERDNHRCRICGNKGTSVHLHPRHNSQRTATAADCITLCTRCHGRLNVGNRATPLGGAI